MEHDAEAAGLASAGALSSGMRHPVDTGEPCRNCGTLVTERFCPACGQLGASFQRPGYSLIASSIGDLFAFDGRLWRTLPALLFRPGRVTRDYIDGKRARYVPPFRLFLLSSVIFYIIVFGVLERQPWMLEFRFNPAMISGRTMQFDGVTLSLGDDEAVTELRARLDEAVLDPAQRAAVEAALEEARSGDVMRQFIRPDGSIDREMLRAAIAEEAGPEMPPAQVAAAQASADRVVRIYENQTRVAQRLKEWAPRLTLLFMPVFSLLLAFSYAWHRRKYIYDNLITGLHFQTFLHVLLGALVLASVAFPKFAPFSPLVAIPAMFAYLGRTLRVAYDTGHILAGLRATFLLFAGFVVVSILGGLLVIVTFVMV
ncbi:DUF3667 domain-containing protein [Hyphomonas sp.]|uniref:DUF3667 domain-containing protein n=1 Tax=Hyphomonas sp. TaxID=87 RepID=UPI00391A4475